MINRLEDDAAIEAGPDLDPGLDLEEENIDQSQNQDLDRGLDLDQEVKIEIVDTKEVALAGGRGLDQLLIQKIEMEEQSLVLPL